MGLQLSAIRLDLKYNMADLISSARRVAFVPLNHGHASQSSPCLYSLKLMLVSEQLCAYAHAI